MAVLRQGNWVGQMRYDVPYARAVESAVAADFDAMGQVWTNNSPFIVAGFNIPVVPNPIGLPAIQLTLNTANGVILHSTASESGTIFTVPSTRPQEILNSAINTNVIGSFQANQVNYVGLDLIRSSDPATSDQVQFLPANAGVANAPIQEISKVIPLARTLNYSIVIQSSTFSSTSNIAPVALVTTDVNNNVLSVEDARSLTFRLGTGSDTPNIYNKFPWSSGRLENPITFTSGSTADPFAGGDKQIVSLKQWMDSIMSRLQEIGGGQYWYTPTNNLNMKLLRVGATFPNGDNFQTGLNTATGAYLAWQGLYVAYDSNLGNDIGNTPTYPNDVQINDNNSTTVTSTTTTIAAGSNGQNIAIATTIFAATTAGFPISGELNIVTSAGTQTVSYASITGGGTPSFNGIDPLAATGTMSTGGAITYLAQGVFVYPGQCVYADINRSISSFPAPAINAQIGNLDSVGQNLLGPPYSRFIIAWVELNGTGITQVYTNDSPFQVGVTSSIATTAAYGTVELNAPQNTGVAVVASIDGTTKNVIGPGFSRGNATVTGVGGGLLTIGAGTFDTSVLVGDSTGQAIAFLPPVISIGGSGVDTSTVEVDVGTASTITVANFGSTTGNVNATIGGTGSTARTSVRGGTAALNLGVLANTAAISAGSSGSGIINIGTDSGTGTVNIGNNSSSLLTQDNIYDNSRATNTSSISSFTWASGFSMTNTGIFAGKTCGQIWGTNGGSSVNGTLLTVVFARPYVAGNNPTSTSYAAGSGSVPNIGPVIQVWFEEPVTGSVVVPLIGVPTYSGSSVTGFTAYSSSSITLTNGDIYQIKYMIIG